MTDILILITVAGGVALLGWLAAGVLLSPPPADLAEPGVEYIARHGRPVDPTEAWFAEMRGVERLQVGRALNGGLICDPAPPHARLPALPDDDRIAAAALTAALAIGYLRCAAAAITAGGIGSYVARTRLAAVQACLDMDSGRHRRAA